MMYQCTGGVKWCPLLFRDTDLASRVFQHLFLSFFWHLLSVLDSSGRARWWGWGRWLELSLLSLESSTQRPGFHLPLVRLHSLYCHLTNKASKALGLWTTLSFFGPLGRSIPHSFCHIMPGCGSFNRHQYLNTWSQLMALFWFVWDRVSLWLS